MGSLPPQLYAEAALTWLRPLQLPVLLLLLVLINACCCCRFVSCRRCWRLCLLRACCPLAACAELRVRLDERLGDGLNGASASAGGSNGNGKAHRPPAAKNGRRQGSEYAVHIAGDGAACEPSPSLSVAPARVAHAPGGGAANGPKGFAADVAFAANFDAAGLDVLAPPSGAPGGSPGGGFGEFGESGDFGEFGDYGDFGASPVGMADVLVDDAPAPTSPFGRPPVARGGGGGMLGGCSGGIALSQAAAGASYEEVADTGHSENSGDDFDIFAFDTPADAPGHRRSSASRGAMNEARGSARGSSAGGVLLGVPRLGGIGGSVVGGLGVFCTEGAATEKRSLLTDIDFLVS